ncbi:MAG: glycosyltransferase family 4 protein [Actinomycetota bacterium]
MRILHVARYGSVRGGAETYVRALCDGLRDAGHQVALAFALEPDRSRDEVREGFEIRALAGDTTPDVEALHAALGSFAPDVVHVHMPDVPWVARAAAQRAPVLLAVPDHRVHCPVGTKYWAAWKRICTVDPGARCLMYNVIAHCGSLRANVTLKPYKGWRETHDAAAAVHLQVFSGWIRDRIVESGIDERLVTVTHYPVPPAVTAIDPPGGERRPVVLASGRLNKEKGFHQLIDALTSVETPVHLVIAGDGHERHALEARARTAPGPHRITFTGWLTASELAGWMRQAALVAVPSMWPEPFGIIGIEAMAAARPVLAFDAGGIREWLDDGVTGRIVAHGDVRALGRTIDELVRDPAARQRMGDAGRQQAQLRFSLVSHVERVIALYGTVRREREGAA